VIHFDFENRYQDELVVGSAISRREGVILSVAAHAVVVALLFLIAFLGPRGSEEPEAVVQVARAEIDKTPIVFMNPRVEKPPAQPRLPELSDRDRRASTVERPVAPENPLPFARGNTPERVEPSAPEEASPVEAVPPPPPPDPPQPTPQPVQPLSEPRFDSQIARATPSQTPPARVTQPAPPRRALEGAIRNPQQFLTRDAFDNQQGGGELDISNSIQFDSKGVDFGSWLRRFKLQVTGNWLPLIPRSAMVNHGHVFLRFYVHKDGTISDLQIVKPSEYEAFTRVAEGAIRASNPTAPLPSEYPLDKMLMTVGFFYNERPPGN
jgi:TonB family protein